MGLELLKSNPWDDGANPTSRVPADTQAKPKKVQEVALPPNPATLKVSGFMEWLMGVPSREAVETTFRQNLVNSPVDPAVTREQRAAPALKRLVSHPQMAGYDEQLIAPLFNSLLARNSDFIDYHPSLQAKIVRNTIDQVFADKDWLGKLSSHRLSNESRQDLILMGFQATMEDYTKQAGVSSVILPALAALLYLRRRQPDHKRVKLRVHVK